MFRNTHAFANLHYHYGWLCNIVHIKLTLTIVFVKTIIITWLCGVWRALTRWGSIVYSMYSSDKKTQKKPQKVKVQIRGPELFKKKGHYFKNDFIYLVSLDLHPQIGDTIFNGWSWFVFVKLEELHIATARKPLFHQTQPVACYQHRNQPCML